MTTKFRAPTRPVGRRLINAWGTATPYGVSRSSPFVAAAVADALREFADIALLKKAVGQALSDFSGADWGCVSHCTAAAITLSMAAIIDVSGNQPPLVAILEGHLVDYGHDIRVAMKLGGVTPLVVASFEDLVKLIERYDIAGVLAVESQLCRPISGYCLTRLANLCRSLGVPLVLDAAAQDMRVKELVLAGPDAVLLSGQKYLAAPTSGLIVGRRSFVDTIDQLHSGIGRGMKPTKESICGVIAALEERAAFDSAGFARQQEGKVAEALRRLQKIDGVRAQPLPDPTQGAFKRVQIGFPGLLYEDAARTVADRLQTGDPIVIVAPHKLDEGVIVLELLALDDSEVAEVCEAIERAVSDLRCEALHNG